MSRGRLETTGIEPATSAVRTREHPVENRDSDAENADSVASAAGRRTGCCTPLPESATSDPDLAAILAAWPRLPEAVRAGWAATARALAGEPAD